MVRLHNKDEVHNEAPCKKIKTPLPCYSLVVNSHRRLVALFLSNRKHVNKNVLEAGSLFLTVKTNIQHFVPAIFLLLPICYGWQEKTYLRELIAKECFLTEPHERAGSSRIAL
jgi:hypothetical protein